MSTPFTIQIDEETSNEDRVEILFNGIYDFLSFFRVVGQLGPKLVQFLEYSIEVILCLFDTRLDIPQDRFLPLVEMQPKSAHLMTSSQQLEELKG